MPNTPAPVKFNCPECSGEIGERSGDLLVYKGLGVVPTRSLLLHCPHCEHVFVFKVNTRRNRKMLRRRAGE